MAIVKPIYKRGDRSVCGNYRGISLLTAGYKVCTRILSERPKPIADTIISEQNGFRKGRSSSDSVFTLKY